MHNCGEKRIGIGFDKTGIGFGIDKKESDSNWIRESDSIKKESKMPIPRRDHISLYIAYRASLLKPTIIGSNEEHEHFMNTLNEG